MFQPHTITFNNSLLLISRYDGVDYSSSEHVPWSTRLNPLRYSLTIWPGTPRNHTFNRDGLLYLKAANAMFALTNR